MFSLYSLLLLLFGQSSNAFLFGNSGGGSCCPPCPPPPICAPPPLCLPPPACLPPLPTLPPPPAARVECCSPCSTGCKKQKRTVRASGTVTAKLDNELYSNETLSRHVRATDADEVVQVDSKCNSPELREIIINNIDRVTAVSKRRIQTAAEEELQARFNVICARGDFSYITNTELYCQQTIGDVTCYVFKQLSDVLRAKI